MRAAPIVAHASRCGLRPLLSMRSCWRQRCKATVLYVVTALFVSAGGPALAQPAAYPTRNVEIIVPYGPGGSTDIVARIVAQKLQDRLGQTFVVLNRPGASGTIGISTAMRANPDGYTLLNSYTAEAVVVPQISKTAQVFDGGRLRADRDHRPRSGGADGVEERQGRQRCRTSSPRCAPIPASTPTAAATAARRTSWAPG